MLVYYAIKVTKENTSSSLENYQFNMSIFVFFNIFSKKIAFFCNYDISSNTHIWRLKHFKNIRENVLKRSESMLFAHKQLEIFLQNMMFQKQQMLKKKLSFYEKHK